MRGKNIGNIKSVNSIEELKTMIMTQDVAIYTKDAVYKLEDNVLKDL